MRVRIKRPNAFVLTIGMIYVISQNFLYLLPNNSVYSRISTAVLLVVLLISLYFNSWKKTKRHQFSLVMISPLILSIIASFIEVSLYSDANYINSILSQAQWWIYGFLYFAIVLLIDRGKIVEDDILHLMVTLGTIQLFIGIAQFLLQNIVVFTHVKTTERLEETRFRFPIVMMCFACMYGVGRVFKGEKLKQGIVLTVATLFEAMFVQQFRSTAVGLVVAIIIGYLIWKKKISRKVFIGLVAVIAFLIFYRRSTFLRTSIEYMLGGKDISLGVRSYNINFLLQNIYKKPLFGNGWVSSSQSAYFASTGYRLNTHIAGFSFADGGIFSIAYSYGALGIAWVAYFWIKMIKNGISIIRLDRDYTYFLFPLYMVITMYIDIHWYIFDQFYVMALFAALSEYKILSLRKNRSVENMGVTNDQIVSS